MNLKLQKIILLKGEKIITVRASKRAKAHKRKVKSHKSEKVKFNDTNLQLFESNIRNQDFESCAAFDESGKMIFNKDGETSRININEGEGVICKGSVFCHNHPKGFSFSPSDILCACHNEMKEMRCISKADGSKYSMSMKDGSNFNRKLWDDKIESVYRDADSRVRSEFTSAMYNEEMTIQQCNNAHWNRVWGLVAEICPELKYKVIK